MILRPFKEMISKRVTFLDPLNLTFPNISTIELPQLHLVSGDSTDLSRDADDLKTVEKKLEEMKMEHRTSRRNTYASDLLSYASYTCTSILFIIIFVKIGLCSVLGTCFMASLTKWCCRPCRFTNRDSVTSPQATPHQDNYVTSSGEATAAINNPSARPLLIRRITKNVPSGDFSNVR